MISCAEDKEATTTANKDEDDATTTIKDKDDATTAIKDKEDATTAIKNEEYMMTKVLTAMLSLAPNLIYFINHSWSNFSDIVSPPAVSSPLP